MNLGFSFCFFLFLVVLLIITTVATSLYLYFSSFVPSLASDCKKVKSWCMLSRNRFCLLDGKIRDKSPDHLFDLNFFNSILHTIVFQASVLSYFDLSCRSAYKKFFSLCCHVFLSFCPCFSFSSFANLKLSFSS